QEERFAVVFRDGVERGGKLRAGDRVRDRRREWLFTERVRLSGAERVHPAVPRDPEQPARELRVAAVGADEAERADERLLRDVVRERPVAREVVGEAPDVGLIGADELLEGAEVSRLGAGKGSWVGVLHAFSLRRAGQPSLAPSPRRRTAEASAAFR